MSKLKLSASKEIWDETNPLPCVRIAFLSDFTDGNLLIDWEKWIDFVNHNSLKNWEQTFEGDTDYERSLEGANKWILLNFINWL